MQKIISGISKEEFYQNFKKNIIVNNIREGSKYFDSDVFLGQLKKDNFYYFWKKRYVRNSYTTTIKGKIIENSDGICIEYKFDKFLSVKIFSRICSIYIFGISFILLLALHPACLFTIPMGLFFFIPTVYKSKKRKLKLLEQLEKITLASQD